MKPLPPYRPFKAFKTENILSLPEPALINALAEELRNHTEGTEDLEEARIDFGEDEESRIRKYLLNWIQRRLLQDFPDRVLDVRNWFEFWADEKFRETQELKKHTGKWASCPVEKKRSLRIPSFAAPSRTSSASPGKVSIPAACASSPWTRASATRTRKRRPT